MLLHVKPSLSVLADDAAKRLAEQLEEVNKHLPGHRWLDGVSLTAAKQRLATAITPVLTSWVLTVSELVEAVKS